jgi:hypothetical protein
VRTFETDIAALLEDVEPVLVERLHNNEMLDEDELEVVDEYFEREIALYNRDMNLENEDC